MTYQFIDSLIELLPEQAPAESIISRKIYSDDHVTVTLFSFAAGQELTAHTAAYPAELLFLQGVATLTLGNDTVGTQVGSWVHMPAHLPHSVFAHTPLLMLLTLYRSKE